MDGQSKTMPQLINEYLKLRQKVGELEQFKNETVKNYEILQKFKLLFSEIDDLAYICDVQGNLIYVNEVFEKFTNHKPEEFLGKPFVLLLNIPDLRKAVYAHTKTLKGEPQQYVLTFKETGVVCEYKNAPMRDECGKIIGVIGIGRDITERKRVEAELNGYRNHLEDLVRERTKELIKTNERLLREILEKEKVERALKEAERLYKDFFENSHDAVFIAETDTGIIIYANKKAGELIGLPVKDIIGVHQTKLHPVESENLYSKLFHECTIKEGASLSEDIYVIHSSGMRVPVEITTKTMVMNGKKVIMGIFRDITERKCIEFELRSLYTDRLRG